MFERFRRRPAKTEPTPQERGGILASDADFPKLSRSSREDVVWARTIQRSAPTFPGMAMDEAISSSFTGSGALAGIPDMQLAWYASHAFIGYQACAMLSQHWLIDRACTLPARDAVRTGYDITVNDGTEVSAEVIDALAKFDRKRGLNRQMVQFVRMGRVFGIRVALFEVESDDPRYYEKPFNPDGVRPGSYKGISQVDPYWMSPWLSSRASTDPSAPDFYEPTWWSINGKRYHRSHLVIMRTSEPPDILKPTYLYGGVPIPQMIAERVYAAERVASEMPALALSKRATVLHTDVERVLLDQQAFEERIAQWAYFRDNYGIKVVGNDETVEQFETTLANLDDVVMTAYQIVAAASGVPATKLLGTTPKGFNATGAYEEAAYHEELESIQTHDLTPLVERHHLLAIRSEIAPKFEMKPFSTEVAWRPLDAMTAKEQAEVNKIKAETAAIYVEAGVLDGEDERDRLIADENSGYSGITNEAPADEGENNLATEAPDA